MGQHFEGLGSQEALGSFSCVQSPARGEEDEAVSQLLSGIALGGAVWIIFISTFLHFSKTNVILQYL